MSLNDGVLDDIDDDSPIDNEVIKAPSDIPVNKEPVTIVAKTEEVKDDVTPMTQQDMENLLSMDVEFKVVKDQHQKVVELEEVESEIIAQEAMCRQTAEYIQSAFENFIGTSFVLEEFTQQPSQTNFSRAKKYMRTRISLEHGALVAKFEQLLDIPLEHAKQVVNELVNNCLPELRNELQFCQADASSLAELFKTSKDFVVPYENDFINITTADLKSLDFNAVGLDFDKPLLTKTVMNLNQLFESRLLVTFIHGCIEVMAPEFLLTPEAAAQYLNRPISMVDLMDFFKASTPESYLNDIQKILENRLKDLEEVQEASNAAKGNYEAIEKFIIENDDKIQSLHKVLMQSVNLVFTLSHLTFNVKSLMKFYQKF